MPAAGRTPPAGGRLPPLRMAAVLLLAWLAAACASNRFEHPRPGLEQRGIASWYGDKFHGRPTASGEIYDMEAMTAAHRELPLGTIVDVTNLDNGRRVRVRVNDRGPFIRGRILDLSKGAARKLGMLRAGLAKIELRVVDLGSGRPGPVYTSAYTVQVGAFRRPANAEALRDRLRRRFDDVEVVTRHGLHRVRVGRFRDRDEAEDLRRQLVGEGLEAMVVGVS